MHHELTIVLSLGMALLAGMALAQEADPKAWQDIVPTIPSPVKRLNDKYPLSDQMNSGNWVKYAPMWDEFSGKKLDDKKWYDHNPTWKGRQPGYFSPGNVAVKDGQLQLTLRREDPPEAVKGEGYKDFTSAAVQSKGTVLYGYFEVKARPMRSHGSSAFWFYNSQPEEWTEIDVFEIGGGAPGFMRKLFMTVHVMHTPTVKSHFQVGGIWDAPFDLADEPHVYGLEWNEKEIVYYFDGQPVRRGPNTHWHQPLTMNFDSETMGDWFGLPTAEDVLPSTYTVDYVRSWQQKSK